MKPKIWLHIGAEKTGTTSLQRWFKTNRVPLSERGILFPSSVGDFNHIALAAYALDSDKGIEELRILTGANRFPSIEAFREHIHDSLIQEVHDAAPREIHFSNEHCSSRLKDISEVQRLADLCRKVSEDINVVLYIREPVSYFESWYSTFVASGGTSEFPRKPGPDLLNSADWLRLVSKWADVFGRGTIKIRIFDRSSLVDSDIVSDYCFTTGINPSGLKSEKRSNESLGLSPLAYLREINKFLPRIKDGTLNPERRNIAEVLSKFEDARKFRIKPETENFIKEYYADRNELLRERFFPEIPPPLFGEKDKPEYEEYSISKDDIFKISKHLWTSKG